MELTREYIEEAFRTPVRRERLKYVLGCKSDREARKVVEQLRKTYNIVNLQDGRGYFIADDETTLKYAVMRRRRALSEFRAASMMEMRCRKRQGMKIPVRAHFRTIGADEPNRNQMSMEELS